MRRNAQLLALCPRHRRHYRHHHYHHRHALSGSGCHSWISSSSSRSVRSSAERAPKPLQCGWQPRDVGRNKQGQGQVVNENGKARMLWGRAPHLSLVRLRMPTHQRPPPHRPLAHRLAGSYDRLNSRMYSTTRMSVVSITTCMGESWYTWRHQLRGRRRVEGVRGRRRFHRSCAGDTHEPTARLSQLGTSRHAVPRKRCAPNIERGELAQLRHEAVHGVNDWCRWQPVERASNGGA